MPVIRAQWPHTVDDIVKALDGVWGVVAAMSVSGNKLHLERSFKTPFTYRFVEFKGTDENIVLRECAYATEAKNEAVTEFAKLLGFNE